MTRSPEDLIPFMKGSLQCRIPNVQTIYEHCVSVTDYITDLLNHVFFNNLLKYTWKISDIMNDNTINILKSKLLDENNSITKLNSILEYSMYHDCGKPFCISVDEKGNNTFKNHEIVSYQTWIKYNGDEYIGQLILHDMVLHKYTVKELDNIFDKLDHSQWCILILSALAEVHSNAAMFGGIDSVNFKIKLKRIVKNIKHILKKI
jgi:hypothetical protein